MAAVIGAGAAGETKPSTPPLDHAPATAPLRKEKKLGRSVSTPSNAVEVLYLDWIPDEDTLNEMVDESLEINDALDICRHDREQWAQSMIEDEFEYLIEDFRDNVLGTLFPSVDKADRWAGREDHVIAENGLAEFGISEYAGLAALWVRVLDRHETYGSAGLAALAEHWISQAWPKIEAMYPHRLGLVGRFSNGEAVYQRAEKGQDE